MGRGWKRIALDADTAPVPYPTAVFKALKQNLRVKTFIGTSPNALKTQVWAALIAMLLIKYLQLKATFGWSLSNLVALLRQQLFVYRDLWVWTSLSSAGSARIAAGTTGDGLAVVRQQPVPND